MKILSKQALKNIHRSVVELKEVALVVEDPVLFASITDAFTTIAVECGFSYESIYGDEL